MTAMKKQMTAEQFDQVVKAIEMGDKQREIAKAALVDGVPQTQLASQHGLTKGAVSQTVARVWAEFEKGSLPAGFERISAILPEHQAFIVKRWAEEADRKRGMK